MYYGKDQGTLYFHSDLLKQTPRKAVILGCAPMVNLCASVFLMDSCKPVLNAFLCPAILFPAAELLWTNSVDIFLCSVKGSLVASNPLALQTSV